MVANFIAISPGVLCEGRKIVYLELVLQIMFIGDLIVQSFYDFDKNRDDRYINTFVDPNKIAIIRNLRLFKYGNLIRDVVYVSQTLTYLTAPIASKLFFIYLVFYEYALLGSIFFGGDITFASYA